MIQKYEEQEITQNNTIKSSTTEISVENCSRMISSSSSSISTRAMTAITSSSTADNLNDVKCADDGNDDGGKETNGILNGEIDESGHPTNATRNVENIESADVDMTEVDGGRDVAATVTTKSSRTILSKITTNGSGSMTTTTTAANENKSNANTPDSVKACELLSHFAMTPTTKLPPPEVTMQRPLKPQSEMDFSVPYNIINNYFSVGVVSKRRTLGNRIPFFFSPICFLQPGLFFFFWFGSCMR